MEIIESKTANKSNVYKILKDFHFGIKYGIRSKSIFWVLIFWKHPFLIVLTDYMIKILGYRRSMGSLLKI